MKKTNELDLNTLSFNELKAKIEEMQKVAEVERPVKPKGTVYCLVRTYSAGVFAGYYDRNTKGKEGTVFEARRLWYWDGASSLSQLANEGVKKPNNCKFAQIVPEVDLKEIIEVLPCSELARKNILSVKVWEQ